MFAKAKGIGIAACVLLCTLSLLGSRANVPPRPRMGLMLPPAGVAGAVPVLVEAFVVEVNLPALARLDVSPIGQEPNAVSVDDLLKCLGTGAARVIGGGKVVSQSQERTEVEATETTYFGSHWDAPPGTSYTSYQSTMKLAAGVRPVSETTVSVQFSIAQTRVAREARTSDAPPATESRSWSSATTLELGRPQIVAATQNSATAIFLVLTAHAQNE
jgi:hypothetical protein